MLTNQRLYCILRFVDESTFKQEVPMIGRFSLFTACISDIYWMLQKKTNPNP